jgi:hypothetical protein
MEIPKKAFKFRKEELPKKLNIIKKKINNVLFVTQLDFFR